MILAPLFIINVPKVLLNMSGLRSVRFRSSLIMRNMSKYVGRFFKKIWFDALFVILILI